MERTREFFSYLTSPVDSPVREKQPSLFIQAASQLYSSLNGLERVSAEEAHLVLRQVSEGVEELKKAIPEDLKDDSMLEMNKGVVAVLFDFLREHSEALQRRKLQAMKQTKLIESIMKPRDSFESQRLPEEFRVKFREAARAMEPSIPVQKQELLRIENEQFSRLLHEELHEVQSVEKKVVEISELISKFNSELAHQSEEVEYIQKHVEMSKKYVQSGEEQLRKTLKSSEEQGRLTVYFILIASACLLFLHWFMD